MKENKMPKAYTVMWSVFAGAYAIWMILFKNTALGTFETVEERTVQLFAQGAPVVFDDITGMIGRHWLYPVWAVISTVCLLLFIVYLKTILYGKEPGKFIKYFCLVNLVFGFVFVTWYALLGDYTLAQKVKNVTASMLGLSFPWHFRMWGVFSSLSVFTNTIYAFRKHNFNSRVGIVLGSIGSAAIFMTINLPSVGEEADFSNPRCLFHWLGALLFAFLCATPLGILLFCQMKKGFKYYKGTFIIFIAMAVVMTLLLVIVGKSALIENIPVWAAYVIMFILNFTNIYSDEPVSKKREKVTVK